MEDVEQASATKDGDDAGQNDQDAAAEASCQDELDAAVQALLPCGFSEKLIKRTIQTLLRVYGGEQCWPFLKENGYGTVMERILANQEGKSHKIAMPKSKRESDRRQLSTQRNTTEGGISKEVFQNEASLLETSDDGKMELEEQEKNKLDVLDVAEPDICIQQKYLWAGCCNASLPVWFNSEAIGNGPLNKRYISVNSLEKPGSIGHTINDDYLQGGGKVTIDTHKQFDSEGQDFSVPVATSNDINPLVINVENLAGLHSMNKGSGMIAHQKHTQLSEDIELHLSEKLAIGLDRKGRITNVGSVIPGGNNSCHEIEVATRELGINENSISTMVEGSTSSKKRKRNFSTVTQALYNSITSHTTRLRREMIEQNQGFALISSNQEVQRIVTGCMEVKYSVKKERRKGPFNRRYNSGLKTVKIAGNRQIISRNVSKKVRCNESGHICRIETRKSTNTSQRMGTEESFSDKKLSSGRAAQKDLPKSHVSIPSITATATDVHDKKEIGCKLDLGRSCASKLTRRRDGCPNPMFKRLQLYKGLISSVQGSEPGNFGDLQNSPRNSNIWDLHCLKAKTTENQVKQISHNEAKSKKVKNSHSCGGLNVPAFCMKKDKEMLKGSMFNQNISTINAENAASDFDPTTDIVRSPRKREGISCFKPRERGKSLSQDSFMAHQLLMDSSTESLFQTASNKLCMAVNRHPDKIPASECRTQDMQRKDGVNLAENEGQQPISSKVISPDDFPPGLYHLSGSEIPPSTSTSVHKSTGIPNESDLPPGFDQPSGLLPSSSVLSYMHVAPISQKSIAFSMENDQFKDCGENHAVRVTSPWQKEEPVSLPINFPPFSQAQRSDVPPVLSVVPCASHRLVNCSSCVSSTVNFPYSHKAVHSCLKSIPDVRQVSGQFTQPDPLPLHVPNSTSSKSCCISAPDGLISSKPFLKSIEFKSKSATGNQIFIGGIPEGLGNVEAVLQEVVGNLLKGFEFVPDNVTAINRVNMRGDHAFIDFSSEAVAGIVLDSYRANTSLLKVNGQQLLAMRNRSFIKADADIRQDMCRLTKGQALLPCNIFYVGNIPENWHNAEKLTRHFSSIVKCSSGNPSNSPEVFVYLLPKFSDVFLQFASEALADLFAYRCIRNRKHLTEISGSVFTCRNFNFIPRISCLQSVPAPVMSSSKKSYQDSRSTSTSMYSWPNCSSFSFPISVTAPMFESKSNRKVRKNLPLDLMTGAPGLQQASGPLFLVNQHCLQRNGDSSVSYFPSGLSKHHIESRTRLSDKYVHGNGWLPPEDDDETLATSSVQYGYGRQDHGKEKGNNLTTNVETG